MTLLCVMMMIPAAAAPKNRVSKNRMGIVAHRGFWNCEEAGYARNSLAALRCAQEAGFWGSEFDVNMTADDTLIVFHDSKIDGKLIEDYPFAEFKNHRLVNGEPIPTLDQYLEQGKLYPETMLVYELKPHSSPEVEDRFVRLTIESLEKHGLLDPKRVMFISFSFHICQRLLEYSHFWNCVATKFFRASNEVNFWIFCQNKVSQVLAVCVQTYINVCIFHFIFKIER